MFHKASMKLGLDQAVLQNMEGGGKEGGGGREGGKATLSKEELERLLRHGAYDVFKEEREGGGEC